MVFDPGELKVEKRVGKRDGKLWFIDIENSNNKNLIVKEKDGTKSKLWNASIDSIKGDGTIDAVVFQKEFSGILTGNLGKSYIYANQSQRSWHLDLECLCFLG